MTSELAEKIGAKTSSESIQHFNLYLYGDYGAGKTHLAATAQDNASTAPVLFLDIEGGAATFRKRTDVEVVQVRTIQKLTEIYGDLRADEGKTYKTVVVDSLTELQKLDIKEIMFEVCKKDRERDPDVPSMREWGKTLSHMRNIVRAYKDLQCNVIMTALAVKNKDDNTGQTTVMPALQGRALFEIPAFFDVVAYLDTIVEKDKVTRRLITQHHPVYRAKDRLGLSESGIVLDPTVPKLWEALNS